MPGRIEANELLFHPMRGRIYEVLANDGPMAVADLAHACDCSISTILWHVRKLAAAGIVARQGDGRGRVFRIVASSSARMALGLRMLGNHANRALLARAMHTPGCLVLDADDPGSAMDAAQRMRAAGMLEIQDWDGNARAFPTALAQQVMRYDRGPRGAAA